LAGNLLHIKICAIHRKPLSKIKTPLTDRPFHPAPLFKYCDAGLMNKPIKSGAEFILKSDVLS
jgi:hypothetical protein